MNITSDNQTKSKLFNTLHRLVITDEASKYHTLKEKLESKGKTLNTLMNIVRDSFKKTKKPRHSNLPSDSDPLCK